MPVKTISLDAIVIEGCQSRLATNEPTVEEYSEAWEAKAKFPPVDLFNDGGNVYWVGDGIHRVLSARRAGRTRIKAIVHAGNRDDAVLFSAGANQHHGLKRSNADKRKAVLTVLMRRPEWSNRRIAKHVGVGNALVASVRGQLHENAVEQEPTTRVGLDGRRRQAPPTQQVTENDGTEFDVDELEAEQESAPPRRRRQGAPAIPASGRQKARKALGQLIRVLHELDLYDEFRAGLSQIEERLGT